MQFEEGETFKDKGELYLMDNGDRVLVAHSQNRLIWMHGGDRMELTVRLDDVHGVLGNAIYFDELHSYEGNGFGSDNVAVVKAEVIEGKIVKTTLSEPRCAAFRVDPLYLNGYALRKSSQNQKTRISLLDDSNKIEINMKIDEFHAHTRLGLISRILSMAVHRNESYILWEAPMDIDSLDNHERIVTVVRHSSTWNRNVESFVESCPEGSQFTSPKLFSFGEYLYFTTIRVQKRERPPCSKTIQIVSIDTRDFKTNSLDVNLPLDGRLVSLTKEGRLIIQSDPSRAPVKTCSTTLPESFFHRESTPSPDSQINDIIERVSGIKKDVETVQGKLEELKKSEE